MEKNMKVKTNDNGAKQLKDLGFEKIPTEDGFQMFVLDPAKLKEDKPKKECPGLRIVEHVKWEGKDYALPFYGMDLETDRNKMITIQNRFGGNSVTIPWFAAAVYDVIMGSEKLGEWDDHRKGIDWFAEHFPKAYMVLLD
jgi:hypothetical protein